MVSFYKEHGYAIVPGVFTGQEVDGLIDAMTGGGVFDYSNANSNTAEAICAIPKVANEILNGKLKQLADEILGAHATVQQALVLDKTKQTNWGLDWHQDLKIAVAEKIETPGYTNWSMDVGVQQVTPPPHVFNSMVSVRLHLDDCDSSNGAIWAIAGTHKHGIIPQDKVAETVNKNRITECIAPKGSVMLMSPLLLHKSPYSLSATSRRILHIEYRSVELDAGLQWRFVPWKV